jgi:hypothetical protein
VFPTAVAVTALLALLIGYTAAKKFGHRPDVVRSYGRVGVPEHRLNALALVLLAGAAGVLLGLYWAPIGIAAATGLVVYFVLAVGAHLRARDVRNVATPVVMLLLSIATLVLRLATT